MPLIDNAHALVIGIATYQTIRKLPTSVLNDARAVYDLLIDPRYCGYSGEKVNLLLDEDATAEAIRRSLRDLSERTDTDSTVFIYISSHGGRIESGPGAGEYLLPVDAKYGSDELRPESAISGEEFTLALRAIPARKLVIVFDCCHAGGIGQAKGAESLKSGFSDHYYDLLKQGRGRVILASSRNTELSWIKPGAPHSLFTEHFLLGLKGGIASEDGLVRIFDLFEYVQPRVTADQADQHPIFKAEVEENFPVALYLGGEKGVVLRDSNGFRYDAYISYVDREPDSTFVWKTLVPRLKENGLRVAVSGDVEGKNAGTYRVVNMERGIAEGKRTIVILSSTYLTDHITQFENVMGQMLGLERGEHRLLPVKITPLDESVYPLRLRILNKIDLSESHRSESEFQRLINALQGPVPHM